MTHLPYDNLPGAISKRALEEHLKLFDGYVEGQDRVDGALESLPITMKSSADEPIRGQLSAQSFISNAIYFHNLFFQSLTPHTIRPAILLALDKVIEDQWEDPDDFYTALVGTAMLARGWALVTVNMSTKEGLLDLVMVDGHDVGLLAGQIPILAIDVWEHAYWMDHGADKEGYLKALMPYINWPLVSERYLSIVGNRVWRSDD